MKASALGRMAALGGLLVLLTVLAAPARAETMDDIATLAQRNVGEEVLLATVEKARNAFPLTAADILKLKDAKVPDKVIAAMIRHKGEAGEAAVAPPRDVPPPKKAAPTAAELKAPEPPPDGILNIENVDDKAWSYSYEPETETLWISTALKSGRGNLKANGGVAVRFPAGTYKVRYNGEEIGPEVTVFSGEKSSLLLTRVDTTEIEALYVTVFEKGARKGGSRLVTLRQTAPNQPSRPPARRVEERQAEDYERRPVERVVVERERIVEVPSTTVIYRDAYVPPAVIYAPPVVYRSSYYTPCYPSSYYPRTGYFSVGFGSSSHHNYHHSYHGYRSYHSDYGHHSRGGIYIGIGGRY